MQSCGSGLSAGAAPLISRLPPSKKDHTLMPTSRNAILQTTSALAVALALLTARPAAAQDGTLNLSSGDIVTVSGVGTFSSQADGTNSTSVYDAGDNFEAVDAEAGSTFNLAGGTITGEAGDSAIFASAANINISSGFVSSTDSGTDGLDASSGSTVNITGGSFRATGSGGSPGAVSPFSAIPFSVTPFSVTPLFNGPPLSAIDIYAESGSAVSITGGLFSTFGAGTVGFYAINSGMIDLYGTGFTVNGSAASGPLTTGSGTLSGTLLNGDSFTNLPYTVLGGTINFTPAAVPEASTTVSFGLLLLGLGAFCVRSRLRHKKELVGGPA